MINMDIRGIKEAERALKNTPEQVPLAISRALNRSATAARSQMARSTAKRYQVSRNDVLKTMKILKANRNRLNASVSSKGKNISLIKFVTSSSSGGKGNRPVIVSVKKGSSKEVEGAFVAAGRKNKRLNVLARTTKNRYPLEYKQTAAIPIMIGAEDIMQEVEVKTQATLEKRIAHELKFALGGSGT